jgi:hypothetical protein
VANPLFFGPVDDSGTTARIFSSLQDAAAWGVQQVASPAQPQL